MTNSPQRSLRRAIVYLAVLLPLVLSSIETSHAKSDTMLGAGQQSIGPITIALDATDAPRKILHAHLRIPAKPGPLTLVYPKWIPGEHGPTGPITDLAGLKITAGTQTVAWRRDDVDMYAFHVEVP